MEGKRPCKTDFAQGWTSVEAKYKGNGKRPGLDDGCPLTSRRMLTRAPRRICATPSLTTASSGKGHQGTLLRSAMRTFPSRLRDPESRWAETGLSIRFFVCLPPLGIRPPQKMNINFSCPVESSLTPWYSHLCPLLRLNLLISNEVIGSALNTSK